MNIKIITEFHKNLSNNIEKVILGKQEIIDLVIMAAICGGHLLIEDVPGTGKTMLAKCLAKSLEAEFRRIQFTPDMLPSDVTGLSLYNQARKDFDFKNGPIFGNIILADEINRASPKTQSALLEAMEENQVTVDGVTHQLPNFFMVLATQNPIDYEGTFSLPEAQLDRFLMRLKIGYLDQDTEIALIAAQKHKHPYDDLQPVGSIDQLLVVRGEAKKVFVSPEIAHYIVSIINKTRENEAIYLGASPRGSLALYRLGHVKAAFCGREFVIPDDIKNIAKYAIAHRIILNPSLKMAQYESEGLIEDILDNIPVPGG